MTGDLRPDSSERHGRNGSLTVRLAPVQDTLAELTREYIKLANADHDPAMWSIWSDLSNALMSVRNAQGRDARSTYRHRLPA